MSTELFNTQLVAQQISQGKDLTGVARKVGSKSEHYSQSHDALKSDDQKFLKTLQSVSENQRPSQNSNPPDGHEIPVVEECSLISEPHHHSPDGLDKTDNFFGIKGHFQTENKVVAGGQNIESATINLLDLLKQLGLEFLLTDGHRRIAESTVQGENAKSGAIFESSIPDSTKFSSIDLARLEKLLMQLQTNGNPSPSDENHRLVQLIRALTSNENLNLTKDPVLQNLFQDASSKSQGFQIDTEYLKEALKNIHDHQLVNEKTNVAAVARKTGSQLSQLSTPSQNLEMASSETRISGDTTEADKDLLARLDGRWTSKDIIGGGNILTQNLTEIHRMSSNPSKEPAPEIGQNVQKQILKSDLQGNPVAKSESGPLVINPPSRVNHVNAEQGCKMTNLNPGSVSADKIVTQVLAAETDVKDNGLLFNQSQNEVKTPDIKLVTSEAEMLQKEFRSQTVNQIVQKAVLQLNSGQHEVRLDLKPDFLGHIRMQIITENQHVTVRILTEYPIVKELIENNLQQLRSELQNHGLEIDELDVSVEDGADQNLADRKMAAPEKTKSHSKIDEQAVEGPSKDITANRIGSRRDESSTRIDFFA